MSRIPRFLLITLLIAALLVAGWFGLRWTTMALASLQMANANGHIERANRLLSDARLEDMGSGSFTSLGNIERGTAAMDGALPLMRESREETAQAAAGARRARALILLPSWYSQYLEKKEQIANLRLEQLGRQEESATSLQELYASGALIFTSVEEMDRLQGRLQGSLGSLPGNPREAGAQITQIAESMRQIQKQLDDAHQERDFQLLFQLSRAAGSSADLAEAAIRLAEATAAGDQARAQQSAVDVESRTKDAVDCRDYLDLWWKQEVSTLSDESGQLQSRQEELESEAAEIYGSDKR